MVASDSPLMGRLFDDRGNLMSPSFCKKGASRRYRYYVCRAILQNETATVGSVGRVPASLIEDVVAEAARPYLRPIGAEEGWRAAPKRVSLREAIEHGTISAKGVEIILRGASTKHVNAPGLVVRRG